MTCDWTRAAGTESGEYKVWRLSAQKLIRLCIVGVGFVGAGGDAQREVSSFLFSPFSSSYFSLSPLSLSPFSFLLSFSIYPLSLSSRTKTTSTIWTCQRHQHPQRGSPGFLRSSPTLTASQPPICVVRSCVYWIYSRFGGIRGRERERERKAIAFAFAVVSFFCSLLLSLGYTRDVMRRAPEPVKIGNIVCLLLLCDYIVHII